MKSIKRSLSALTCTQTGSDSMTPDTIRAARIAAGLTQKQLGEAAGYADSTAQPFVASWEAGTRPIPRDKIREVAKALNIEPTELI